MFTFSICFIEKDLHNFNQSKESYEIPVVSGYTVSITCAFDFADFVQFVDLQNGGQNRYKPKHELLIKKREQRDLKHFQDSKAFIDCSDDMKDVYEGINPCNSEKNIKY